MKQHRAHLGIANMDIQTNKKLLPTESPQCDSKRQEEIQHRSSQVKNVHVPFRLRQIRAVFEINLKTIRPKTIEKNMKASPAPTNQQIILRAKTVEMTADLAFAHEFDKAGSLVIGGYPKLDHARQIMINAHGYM